MTNITIPTMRDFTVAEKFEIIKNLAEVQSLEAFDAVAFLDSRIEQAKRKSSDSAVAKERKRKANQPLIEAIESVMREEGKPMKVGDIAFRMSMSQGKAISIPKVTSLLKDMNVANIKDGKNSLYSLN